MLVHETVSHGMRLRVRRDAGQLLDALGACPEDAAHLGLLAEAAFIVTPRATGCKAGTSDEHSVVIHGRRDVSGCTQRGLQIVRELRVDRATKLRVDPEKRLGCL